MTTKMLTTDLGKIKLQTETNKTGGRSAWIEIINTISDANHPLFDEITSEQLNDFVSNFKAGIPKDELPIDYFHRDWEEAAGWLTDLRLSNNGNLIEGYIEFTPRATAMILSGEIRYFSPTFAIRFEPRSGDIIKNVLLGGGLTNIPFLDLSPIELSKRFGEIPKKGASKVEKIELEKIVNEKIELTRENEALKVSLSLKEKEVAALKSEKEEIESEKVKLSQEIKVMNEKVELESFESEFAKLVSEGKAVPAQKEFFKLKFSSEEVKKFGENAPVVIELSKSIGQSGGEANKLTEQEIRVQKQTGFTDEQIILARKGAK